MMTNNNNAHNSGTPRELSNAQIDDIKHRIRSFKCSTEFDESKTDWAIFLQRFELELQLQDLTGKETIFQEARRNLVLKWIGPTSYKRITDHFSPKTVFEISYEEIVAFLNSWFCPSYGYLTERLKLRNIARKPNQDLTQYINEIRAASKYCKFGATLEEQIRDQFLFGLQDPLMQEELLRRHPEGKDDLKDILTTALLLEHATKQRQQLQANASTHNTAPIHKMTAGLQPNRQHQRAEFPTTYKEQQQTRYRHAKQLDPQKDCLRCGRLKHLPREVCPAKHTSCRACKAIGHWEIVCVKTGNAQVKTHHPTPKKAIHTMADSSIEDQRTEISCAGDIHNTEPFPEEDTLYTAFQELHNCSTTLNPSPVMINVCIDGAHILPMEVDSGAAYSIMPTKIYDTLWPNTSKPPLQRSLVHLQLWDSQPVQVMGQISVAATYGNITANNLPLLIASSGSQTLLGRNWFQPLGISIQGISNVTTPDTTTNWKGKFPLLFDTTLGKANGPPIKLQLKQDAQPVFLPARPVPLPLRKRVDEALENLVKEGTLTPTQYSLWATPIVPVHKRDGSTRICMDYRSTVNSQLKNSTYPLPVISEMLTSLSGGTIFSKLDMAQAYLQLVVDEEAAEILTVNTHKGLFRVNRLPFGLSASPGIFQRFLETLLAGIDGIAVYLDDVVVSGKNTAEHDDRLNNVLMRMEQAGLRLKSEKCCFGVHEIQFVGYKIAAAGISPTAEKVTAIRNAPVPQNKTQLQAFLGLVNFYHCFLKDKATISEPLHRLLDSRTSWNFGQQELLAFNKIKEMIQSSTVLTHYSLEKEIVLTCDASPYGVGAVLSHPTKEGIDKPIAFASRTLSPTERRYAQIDREALAIVFGVLKFHRYIAGRHVTIVTDHKPLLGLLSPNKPIPLMVSPRMLRWNLFLSNYTYTLEYRAGIKVANADALSRLPLPEEGMNLPNPAEVLMIESSHVPITADLIKQMTDEDTTLTIIRDWVIIGSTPDGINSNNSELTPYMQRLTELSVQNGCVLMGSRVIIPKLLRTRVLEELHAAHPGIVQMKMLSRAYVWWPGLDKDIQNFVNTCTLCQSLRHLPPKATPSSWSVPQVPWQRLHLDTFGPISGQKFLLVVDAYSKWVEVEPLMDSSSLDIMNGLRRIFATHGIPEVVVTDNASYFTSVEFADFLNKNVIHQVKIPIYHPASNGQAERYVQSAKQTLTKLLDGNWETRLSRYLLHQHVTPSTVTGKSPAELLLGRRLRTVLDAMRPTPTPTTPQRELQSFDSRMGRNERYFERNELVYVSKFRGNTREWIPARVIAVIGNRLYKVQCADGSTSVRHVDHLRKRHVISPVDGEGML